MAFVNEITPEELKDKFTFNVSTRPDGSRPTLWKWTVDKERNAFLVCTHCEGGGYEGTPLIKHFVLSWKQQIISLSAIPIGTEKVKHGVVMKWRVDSLKIPPEIKTDEKIIINLIQEAFAAMGDVYDGDQYASVDVLFNLKSAI